jgi:hypothetical protein
VLLGLGLGGWHDGITRKELYTCAVDRREGPHINLQGPRQCSPGAPPAVTKADGAVTKTTRSDAFAFARASAKAVVRLGRASAGSPRQKKGSLRFSLPGTCSASKWNSSISSSQRTTNRLTSHFVRIHVTAWLFV